jgi:hypothetical protein
LPTRSRPHMALSGHRSPEAFTGPIAYRPFQLGSRFDTPCWARIDAVEERVLDAHAPDAGDRGPTLSKRSKIAVAGADAAQDRIVGTPAVRIGLGRIECGTCGENAEGCGCHPRESNHDSTSWATVTSSCPSLRTPPRPRNFPRTLRQPLILTDITRRPRRLLTLSGHRSSFDRQRPTPILALPELAPGTLGCCRDGWRTP